MTYLVEEHKKEKVSYNTNKLLKPKCIYKKYYKK
jgi:hypothetical protein